MTDYLASLFGTAAQNGDTYTVLRNGDEVHPAMLAAIAGARSRISFETYLFSEGEIGGQFVAALEAAARRWCDRSRRARLGRREPGARERRPAQPGRREARGSTR